MMGIIPKILSIGSIGMILSSTNTLFALQNQFQFPQNLEPDEEYDDQTSTDDAREHEEDEQNDILGDQEN